MDQEVKKAGGVTGKGFTKGDPRINRKGRPRVFDEVRALALKIAREPVVVKDKTTGEKIEMNRAEVILRKWAASGNSTKESNFIMVAYGKVPEEIVINPETIYKIRVLFGKQSADGADDGAVPDALGDPTADAS